MSPAADESHNQSRSPSHTSPQGSRKADAPSLSIVDARPSVDLDSLRALFDKPYGARAPSQEQWHTLYAEDVHVQDATQDKQGIKAYLAAQAGTLETLR